MSLNGSPQGERVHIALFGRRNAGKSSVINSITGQNLAIVSEVKGTTTDPVYKAMELLPLGPVVMIDTPGLDDEGELGARRVEKTKAVLNKTDVALIVVDITCGFSDFEAVLLQVIQEKKLSYITVLNKSDLYEGNLSELEQHVKEITKGPVLCISTTQKIGIEELKEEIGKAIPTDEGKLQIVGDLIQPGDFVVLVVPIDKAAPKGRLILPQQQTIRDILEADAMAIVTKEFELRETLESLGKKPRLVITDSQVFAKVSADTPKDIMLTSFSILFARYKGDLEELVKGVVQVNHLQDGDKILISEGCTHHRQCDDIGTVKIPRWLMQMTGKKLQFEFTSGTGFSEQLSEYAMIVHCGGCMLNKREMQHRIAKAKEEGVLIVNYGVLIAYMQGILKRSLEPFPHIAALLDE